MKKNFLIMMIMVLCAGFTFAQNTVRGFVPGAGTGNGNATDGYQTYAVFGQMFGDIDFTAANPYEVAEGLAQAQLVAKDTIERVVGCGDDFAYGEFHLTAEEIAALIPADAEKRDTFLTIQHPNAAIYNYDQLLVLHLFVCPCIVRDANNNPYEVISIDTLHCWTKSSLRATQTINYEAVETMSYTSDIVSSLDEATFGYLYTWENASKGSELHCDSVYKIGICPDGWHLPAANEVARILNKNTDDLRTAEGNHWVVAENITNATKFSAQPSGYYKGLAERFEGYHSEADFWYADNDSTCTPNYFQILYYCNVPKQEYRSVDTDAMSVRCVLDMIYDYHKDDSTLSCPFTVSQIYETEQGYAVDVLNFNNDLFTSQEVTFYFYDQTGDDNGYQEGILTPVDVPGSTSKTFSVDRPINMPTGTSYYEVDIRFNLNEDYRDCQDDDLQIVRTKFISPR